MANWRHFIFHKPILKFTSESTATKTTVQPSSCQALWHWSDSSSHSTLYFSNNAKLPTITCWPLTLPVKPMPLSFLNSLTSGKPTWAPYSSILLVIQPEKRLIIEAAIGWLDLVSKAAASLMVSSLQRKKEVQRWKISFYEQLQIIYNSQLQVYKLYIYI